MSEPAGAFPLSDNLVSNELEYIDLVWRLRPDGGVYVGVGPEQNLTYIAALQPDMAFIVDIRRENRNLHLLYKALLELSSDRADFLARLFSRPRPSDLDPFSAIGESFDRFNAVRPSRALYDDTVRLVRDRLAVSHGFPLSQGDLDEMERALETFFREGPEITFWSGRRAASEAPSYRQLMSATDRHGLVRSYLATHDTFGRVKSLHANNLIIPIVGDFAGPTALRAIGDYVRSRSGAVRAFYASNVGVYLTNAQTRAFCGNLTTLPMAPHALFIEAKRLRPVSSKLAACRSVPESLDLELPK